MRESPRIVVGGRGGVVCCDGCFNQGKYRDGGEGKPSEADAPIMRHD